MAFSMLNLVHFNAPLSTHNAGHMDSYPYLWLLSDICCRSGGVLACWTAQLGFRILLPESIFDTLRTCPSNAGVLLDNSWPKQIWGEHLKPWSWVQGGKNLTHSLSDVSSYPFWAQKNAQKSVLSSCHRLQSFHQYLAIVIQIVVACRPILSYFFRNPVTLLVVFFSRYRHVNHAHVRPVWAESKSACFLHRHCSFDCCRGRCTFQFQNR